MYDLMEGVHVLQAIGGSGAVMWLIFIVLFLLMCAIVDIIISSRNGDEPILTFVIILIVSLLLTICAGNSNNVRYIVTMDDTASINEVSKAYNIKTNNDGTYTLTEKDNPNERS